MAISMWVSKRCCCLNHQHLHAQCIEVKSLAWHGMAYIDKATLKVESGLCEYSAMLL